MSIRRVVPNISSDRIDESLKFYTELFGFRVAMDMGWIVTLVSPSNPTAQISLVKGLPAEAMQHPPMTITIEVVDVDAVHAQALAMAVSIIYPLTDEPWNVRRFAVSDPTGVVINIMSHH